MCGRGFAIKRANRKATQQQNNQSEGTEKKKNNKGSSLKLDDKKQDISLVEIMQKQSTKSFITDVPDILTPYCMKKHTPGVQVNIHRYTCRI